MDLLKLKTAVGLVDFILLYVSANEDGESNLEEEPVAQHSTQIHAKSISIFYDIQIDKK